MTKRWLCALATAAFAGCSSAQSLAPYQTLPQSQAQALAQHRARMGPSWIEPNAGAQNLIYVSNQNALYQKNAVYIFTFPAGKLVGEFSNDYEETTEGLCSDSKGNVWILGWITNGQAFYDEYSHGGTNPINSLSGYGTPSACAVNRTTGDLAIANFIDGNLGRYQGDLAIYKAGSGKPTDYYGNTIKRYYYCAYDNKGNLLADGDNRALNELPKGSSTVRNVYLNRKITPGSMQWDGKYITVVALGGSKGPTLVDRITFGGSSAQIVGTTKLTTPGNYGTYLTVQFAIGDGKIMGPGGAQAGPSRNFFLWSYPAGGKDTKLVTESGNPNFYGTAFSAAPQ